ncbi:hypothetical protein TSUD_247810 [Trifolium subterraneum]|uniref:Inhibitor I9 domain-containing protein n=1 Tax=Trifolium subterraneum TaxID=3900 RepID=A0A2Z6PCL6_TRISU|nr:hypothetical protein TSUD_247810 [Trifolium subterraneum]
MDFRFYIGSLILLAIFATILLVVKFYHLSPKNDHKAKDEPASKHELKVISQRYIIYTGHNFKDEATSLSIYHYLLQQVVERSSPPRPILTYFWRSFSGFVADLTDEEAKKMAGVTRWGGVGVSG